MKNKDKEKNLKIIEILKRKKNLKVLV